MNKPNLSVILICGDSTKSDHADIHASGTPMQILGAIARLRIELSNLEIKIKEDSEKSIKSD